MNRGTIERFEPRSLDAAAAMMREVTLTGMRVAFVGGGTHADEPAGVDAILATGGMARVVEYAPADQTVTVEAGITFAALAEVLGREGQRLVLEVAEPERATIGGAIAANAFGPRRMRYGTLKDLILGVGLLRADGTAARAGGNVVKNVAGFDLSKLMVGSYGTLALVTSATLRVHPLAEATRAFRARAMAPERVWAFVAQTRDVRLEPAALIASRGANGDGYAVDVVLEGFGPGVTAKADALSAFAAQGGWPLAETDPAVAAELDARVRRSGPLRVRCSTPSADFAAVDRLAIGPLVRALGDGEVVAYPTLGTAFVAGTPSEGDAIRSALASGRAEAERRGGSLVIEKAGGDLESVERWGTPPPSFGLMRQLKHRFDPQGRLSPHAFVGGL